MTTKTDSDQNKALQAAVAEIDKLFSECCTENWDGHGARPVTHEAYQAAARFLKALPGDVPMPEAAPEPDGEISFEWFTRPDRVFSVSVSPRSELNYAGLFGTNKIHGTEAFFDELPEFVLTGIHRTHRA